MQSLQCEKHKLKKDSVFCLKENCDDRLVCRKCFTLDQKHNGHKFIMVDFFIENDEDEIKRIFSEDYINNMKDNKSVENYIKQVDNKFNKYLDEKEEEMRTPFEKMIANYRSQLEQFKQQIYDKFGIQNVKSMEQIQQSIKDLVDSDNSQDKQNSVKQYIDSYSNMQNIQKKLDSIIKQTQQVNQYEVSQIEKVFKRLEMKQDMICKQYNGQLEYVKYLKQCGNEIKIGYNSNIETCRNNIKQYEEQNKDYRIYMFFDYHTSLQFRQQVIEMIDELNVNHRVGMVFICHDDNDLVNNELLVKMNDRYHNLYYINIDYRSKQVNSQINDQFKLMVIQSTVLDFTLYFYDDLFNNDQGFNLLKQYNEIIKAKTHLEHLKYYHTKINKDTSDKQQIEQMIEQVCNM